MRGRTPLLEDYGWAEAECELSDGIHPEVVAARLGESIAFVLKTADRNRWPIRWQHHETPMQAVDRFARQGFLQ